MELKKNPKSDLEKWKAMFFQIGLIVSLGAILVAFSVTQKKSAVDELGRLNDTE